MVSTQKGKCVFVKGSVLEPMGEDEKLIVHVCNNRGGWGKGFVLTLSMRWKGPEQNYRSLKTYQMGTVSYIQVQNDMWVANLIAQNRYHPKEKQINQMYIAMENGFREINKFAKAKLLSVHMPRIGCGLGGGQWEKVQNIIHKQLSDVKVFVYDL